MKKFMSVIAAILLSLCLAVGLVACGGGGGGGDPVYYTVTFDSCGGSAVGSQQVLEGNPVRVPTSPVKDNFNFDGWFRSTDENAAGWNFSTDRVNGDITLYAHWTQIQESPELEPEPEPEPKPEPQPTSTLQFKMSGEGYIVTGDEGQAANIVIPAEYEGSPVIGIDDRAFAYSNHTADIVSVTIPDSVETIGENAFHNQDALEQVNIGENSSLKSIGSNAFSGCSALKSFYLPAKCVSLGYDVSAPSFANKDSDFIDSYGEVFNSCGALDSFTVAAGNTIFASRGGHLVCVGGEHNASGAVILIRGVNVSEIPSGVTEIGKAAFRGATVTELYIPKSVKKIGNYFADNSAVTSVYYAGSSEAWSGVEKSRMWDYNSQFTVIYDTAFSAAANKELA